MDESTRKHFDKWFEHEFENCELDEREGFRQLMLAEFEDDPEYWGDHSYWELYDKVTERTPYIFND